MIKTQPTNAKPPLPPARRWGSAAALLEPASPPVSAWSKDLSTVPQLDEVQMERIGGQIADLNMKTPQPMPHAMLLRSVSNPENVREYKVDATVCQGIRDRLTKANLHHYGIADVDPEEQFEKHLRMASKMFSVPVAGLAFLDREKQWFKCTHEHDLTEFDSLKLETSFCYHTLRLKSGLLYVPDIQQDQRFSEYTLVMGTSPIRFYAGAPLKNRKGQNVGALCLYDTKPRELSEDQLELLVEYAESIASSVELSVQNKFITAVVLLQQFFSDAKDFELAAQEVATCLARNLNLSSIQMFKHLAVHETRPIETYLLKASYPDQVDVDLKDYVAKAISHYGRITSEVSQDDEGILYLALPALCAQRVSTVMVANMGEPRTLTRPETNFILAVMSSFTAFINRTIAEKQKDQLLNNIFPEPVIPFLKNKEFFKEGIFELSQALAKRHDNVTVFFADIVHFTELSRTMSATKLVEMLNHLFSMLDRLCDVYKIEKIKTIGDAYMAVGNLSVPNDNAPAAMLDLALDMHEFVDSGKLPGEAIQLRAGIHTGNVVAGVIGSKKFAYDVWGDPVNIASRMESSSCAGCVRLTAESWALIPDKSKYRFTEESVTVKGMSRPIASVLVHGRTQSQIKAPGCVATTDLSHALHCVAAAPVS